MVNNRTLPATRYRAFQWLATLIAVVDAHGHMLFANAELEDVIAMSSRSIEGTDFSSFFTEPSGLQSALQSAQAHSFSVLRYEAHLLRLGRGVLAQEPLPVDVIVTSDDGRGEIIIEMVPQEQQTRQDREQRLFEQTQTHKELMRNLAHEIKNPLGGIRGAAQLLQMEVQSKVLTEYTQVIIHEADRLHTLVDRLLVPHRNVPVVGDVNIHEVLERVRALILLEHPNGLRIVRDYDVSIPEIRGDREQLIQAILNITQNAAQAMDAVIAKGEGEITFKTRIARQVTLGISRYKLALELHIIDNGAGVSDALKDKIFQPLVSGREGGSGLGLTLAQTFVQQHHGLVAFDSHKGVTDFKILVPLL